MAAIIISRLPVLMIAICLVLMLLMARKVSKTTDNKIADAHRTQGKEKSFISVVFVGTLKSTNDIKGLHQLPGVVCSKLADPYACACLRADRIYIRFARRLMMCT